MTKILALILAAGRGTRAGAGIPKTYRDIGGKAVLRHGLEVFLAHPQITTVQTVIHQDDQALYEAASQNLALPPPVLGGDTRAGSVANGLNGQDAFDFVLIHDGARPFISAALISRIIAALENHDAAIPAIEVTDALWSTKGASLQAPIPRENAILAQTPQGFDFQKYKTIAQGGDARDDAEAAIRAGLDVVWVKGDKNNKKLTYAEDFAS